MRKVFGSNFHFECKILSDWKSDCTVYVHFCLLKVKTDRRFSSRLIYSWILLSNMLHMIINLSVVALFYTGSCFFSFHRPFYLFVRMASCLFASSFSDYCGGSHPCHGIAMGESAITWPSNEPFTVTKVAI